jgi:hypothetical protein
MIIKHDGYNPPENVNAKIWRFMDLSKCIYMLTSNNLFFSRADKLGDDFEGSWPNKSIEDRNKLVTKEKTESFSDFAKNLCKYAAITCWHVNEYESAAMWDLYLKTGEGIAIQSTYQRLYNCLHNSAEAIRLGLVRYIDYDKDGFLNAGNMVEAFIHKRKSYSHENELRAAIFKLPPTYKNGLFNLSIRPYPKKYHTCNKSLLCLN